MLLYLAFHLWKKSLGMGNQTRTLSPWVWLWYYHTFALWNIWVKSQNKKKLPARPNTESTDVVLTIMLPHSALTLMWHSHKNLILTMSRLNSHPSTAINTCSITGNLLQKQDMQQSSVARFKLDVEVTCWVPSLFGNLDHGSIRKTSWYGVWGAAPFSPLKSAQRRTKPKTFSLPSVKLPGSYLPHCGCLKHDSWWSPELGINPEHPSLQTFTVTQAGRTFHLCMTTN